MAAGSPRDVLRSVQRWAALLLDGSVSASGRPYVVLLAEMNRSAPERPYAVVGELASFQPVLSTARVTVPQGDVQISGTVSLTVFPDPPDGTDLAPGSGVSSWTLAQGVLARLRAGVDHGVLLEGPPEVRFSHPFDVPLFDYDGVPDSGAGRAGPAEPYGWLDVDGSAGSVLEDPEDDDLFSVVLDLRLSAWVAGAVLSAGEAGPVVAAMPGTFVPPSP